MSNPDILERLTPAVLKAETDLNAITAYIGDRNNQLKLLTALKDNIKHTVGILNALENDNRIEIDIQVFDSDSLDHGCKETLLFLERDDNDIQSINGKMKQRLFGELIHFMKSFYRKEFFALEEKINNFKKD